MLGSTGRPPEWSAGGPSKSLVVGLAVKAAARIEQGSTANLWLGRWLADASQVPAKESKGGVMATAEELTCAWLRKFLARFRSHGAVADRRYWDDLAEREVRLAQDEVSCRLYHRRTGVDVSADERSCQRPPRQGDRSGLSACRAAGCKRGAVQCCVVQVCCRVAHGVSGVFQER